MMFQVKNNDPKLGQIINETVHSMVSYLERALPELSGLASEFYQGADETTWETFGHFLDGIGWIMSVLEELSNPELIENPEGVSHRYNDISGNIRELQEAMENSDLIAIADILRYEMIPLLETLKEEMEDAANSRVVLDDLN